MVRVVRSVTRHPFSGCTLGWQAVPSTIMRRLLGLVALLVACSGTDVPAAAGGASGASGSESIAPGGVAGASGGTAGAAAAPSGGSASAGENSGQAGDSPADGEGGDAGAESNTGGTVAGASGQGGGAGLGGSSGAGADTGGTGGSVASGGASGGGAGGGTDSLTGGSAGAGGTTGGAGAGGSGGAAGSDGEPCVCSTGTCCDGCHFRPKSYFCGEVSRSQRCYETHGISSIEHDYWNLFCNGDSTECTRWAVHTKFSGAECPSQTSCVEDGDHASCN